MMSIEERHALQLAKALGDSTRLLIYKRMMETGEMRCGEIGLDTAVQAPTVSHHLKVLKEAGLIGSRRKGRGVYYRALPRALAVYLQYLRGLERRARSLPGTLSESSSPNGSERGKNKKKPAPVFLKMRPS